MHKKPTLLNGPGVHLVLMTWWIFAIFIAHLFWSPLGTPPSHLSFSAPYSIAFAVTIAFAIALNLTNIQWSFWPGLPGWKKILVLVVAYAATIIVILIVTVTLDSYHVIDLGCPAGSFGMLYIPSIVAYFMLGALAMLVLKVIAIFTSHKTAR